MNYLSDIPWSNIASALTTLTLITAIAGPRFKFVRKFVGVAWQDMSGMTDLRADQRLMHESNQQRFTTIETEQMAMRAELNTVAQLVERKNTYRPGDFS